MIPITKPFINSNDLKHIKNVLSSKILTDGYYQAKTESIIKNYLKSKFVAVTHSCTAALEISAILIDLKPGDEVILPSYGFVSIANAIVLRGAKPIFAEIDPIDLNISFLVLTGDEDPINENGKQAEEISNLLIECGFKSEFKSYQGMRHEPLTELERDIVMKRIGKFFGSNV